MHFLVALLPLLTLTSARLPLGDRSRSSSIPTQSQTQTHTQEPRLLGGLLGGLVGGLGNTVGGLGTTVGGVVGGVGGLVGGPVGGVVTGLGNTVGSTVVTVGGLVTNVSTLNLEVLADTCVRLGTAVQVSNSDKVLGGVVDANAAVTLAAGACVCVDAAASVGLSSGVQAKVDVYASGGLSFAGAAAGDIASSTQPGLLGIRAGVYNFNVVETCIAASVSLTNSHHDLQPVGGSCCARACNAGYIKLGNKCCPTGSTLDSNGNCFTVPTCTSSEILCNNACYPRATYTCPSGLPVQNRAKRSEMTTCPGGMSKCSVGGWGVVEEKWECIDTQKDLESCGGCIHPTIGSSSPQGQDCTALPNVNQVGCIAGTCQIQSCVRGFALASNGTICERKIGFGKRSRVASATREYQAKVHRW
ncbi:hypothetical protein CI109_102330 [Kwoniella shandongensis]|uniref:Uncharacterized protein n=1 Tax=Kwoniella shandongensis TaxID=1734106 RepID=A0A5M6C5I8_9TREE|nr:uncharacterized protein CI109_003350 [Kwoniella shandongensis]KAA5528449.1 hypothetical protein CI109_003350 [Kwoniella shandongensis]